MFDVLNNVNVFIGCSGGILFFNLFLERIITLLASVMRRYHEIKIRRENERRGSVYNRRESTISFDDRLDANWKPSVYWVMSVLALFTILIAITASLVYSYVEGWRYIDCIYFCFIAFSTIGFGDLVTDQYKRTDEGTERGQIYTIANFLFIALGCCCIYSLFNVTSIVIKQFLNFLIKKLNFKCKCWRREQPVVTTLTRSRRNALTPNHLKNYANSGHKTVTVKASIADSSDADSTYDSDTERRNSNEMICMRDVLKTNKVSLAILQKELYESAQRAKSYRSPAILLPSKEDNNDFNTGAVGPLAIVSKQLGEDS